MEYSEAALQKVREDRFLIDQVDLWLFEEIEPYLGQRILEVGCGLGNFARHLVDREKYIGTDISTDSVRQVRATYAAYTNVEAHVADVAGPGFLDLERHELDTVFSLNVFEHVEDDLAALHNVWQILRPGGKFILVVPAHEWLYGTIDRTIGHYRRYEKRGTGRLFEEVGFRCLEQKYINAAGAVGWFVGGRIFSNDTPPSGQLRLFNHLVPTLKAIERLIPVPFGISLLAVGEKID